MPLSEYALPQNVAPPPIFADTQLEITAWGQFIYQARDLDQTLEIIQEATQQVRNSNGNMLDLSNPAFRKYKSRVTCSDRRAPPFDAFWPGMIVTVNCCTPLCYKTGNPGSPGRAAVAGTTPATLNGFVFYLPSLVMMIRAVSWTKKDWQATIGWNFEMEEV
jgi:hypothetical protein